MNKFTMLFLGGAIFGASVVVLLLVSGALDYAPESGSLSDNRDLRPGRQYDSPMPDVQLIEFSEVIATLNSVAASLQRSAEKFNSPSFASTIESNPDYEMSSGTQTGPLADQMPTPPNLSTVPAPGAAHVAQQAQQSAPPTPEQVEHYYSLQSRLYNAAYDHSAVLAELNQESNELTPAQRQELVNEALEMIKRGELKAEQFMLQPGS